MSRGSIPTRDQESESPDPIRIRLIISGFTILIALVAIAGLSFLFEYGEGHRERPILSVLAIFAIATAAYSAAMIGVSSRIGAAVDDGALEPRLGLGRRRLPLIVGFSAAFRAVMLVSQPIQEIDYYRYLWDGRATLNGFNPFQYSPQEIDRFGPVESDKTKISQLYKLSFQSKSIRLIFERVHHRDVPTIYPPAAQGVFALAASATPFSAPVWVHVFILKAILVGFDLGTQSILILLLRRLRSPEDLCLAYGWNPLAIKEFANSGHLDSIAVFFTTLAFYRLCGLAESRPGKSTSSSNRALIESISGMALLGVAVLAKSYPVVLIPLASAFLIARLGKKALIPPLVACLVVVAGYAPFPAGKPSADLHSRPHNPCAGLATFLSRWEKNDFLFMLIYENLRVHGGDVAGARRFVIVPANRRAALARSISRLSSKPEFDPAFILTQGIMGSVFILIIIRSSMSLYRDPDRTELLRRVAPVLVWGWLLSAAPHPWYLTWSLPFLVFERRKSWFLITGLAFFYYFRFWVEYQAAPLGESALRSALDRFDHELIFIEYVPFLAALAAETWWIKSRRGSVSGDSRGILAIFGRRPTTRPFPDQGESRIGGASWDEHSDFHAS